MFEAFEATIKFRRDDKFIVKPEAEILDGMTFNFENAGVYEEGLYEGEMICICWDDDWPRCGVATIASGDLIISEAQ